MVSNIFIISFLLVTKIFALLSFHMVISSLVIFHLVTWISKASFHTVTQIAVASYHKTMSLVSFPMVTNI